MVAGIYRESAILGCLIEAPDKLDDATFHRMADIAEFQKVKARYHRHGDGSQACCIGQPRRKFRPSVRCISEACAFPGHVGAQRGAWLPDP